MMNENNIFLRKKQYPRHDIIGVELTYATSCWRVRGTVSTGMCHSKHLLFVCIVCILLWLSENKRHIFLE